jgi:hypothetical protein
VAIDTAEKRRSVAGIPFFPLGPGVTPNASKDQEWRLEAGWSYSGILSLGPLDSEFTNVRVEATSQQGTRIRWSYSGSNIVRVYRSTTGLSYSEIATITPGDTSYDDTGLSAKTKYWYRLSDDGGATWSETVTVVTHLARSRRGQKAKFISRRAKDIVTPQDFNETMTALDEEVHTKYVEEDPCPLCIVDNAIVLDCTSGCKWFRVVMDQDINSISVIGCDDCPQVDFVVKPNETRGICGWPMGCDYGSDECFEGRVPGGTQGRTGKTNGVSYNGYGGPAPQSPPSDCPCPGATLELSIVCCEDDCTLECG